MSEHVPEDNFYRRLKTVLPLDWLYKATQKYYGAEGQQSIDPVVFFKLMLIGYLENLCSDRRIVSMAKMRLDMLYFIGYDIDDPLPWHSTLSRTRQLYGEELFGKLFKKVLGQCIDKGMVAGKRQAMDSIAVQANASMDSLRKKEVLDDSGYYAEQLDQSEGQSVPAKGGIKHISNSIDRRGPVSNHDCYSATGKDAKVSVKPGKTRRLSYLAQVSVDTSHHVITHVQSEHADKKDSQCLPRLLSNTADNLKEQGLQVDEVLADGNYSSSEALKALEDSGIEGYIPDFGRYKASREGFAYDKENDRYACSQGKHLVFKYIKQSHGGNDKMKQYRSSSKDCRACPLRSKCIGKSFEKTIAVNVDQGLYDRMHHRLQTQKAKRMRKMRSSTVEPVLGTLVNFLGMRRVNTKGIGQANKCMLMAAVAYNLKKLLKWQSRKIKIMAMAKMKETKNAVGNLVISFLHTRSFHP